MHEAILAWAEIPTPLANMDEAMERGNDVAIGIAQEVKDRGIPLKPIAKTLDDILENIKVHAYGEDENITYSDEEDDGRDDGGADGGFEDTKEELMLRMLEIIIQGLQGFL